MNSKLKLNLKKYLVRAGIATGTLGVIVAGAAAFSAFEAHVINVTARIENALSVPVDPISFGTVFPQEELERQLSVSLSRSFRDANRVDDVEYVIRQKPKCGVTDNNGQTLVGPTWTGHVVVIPGDPLGVPPTPDTYTVDCVVDQPEELELVGNQVAGLLPSLCEYISKHPDGRDDNQATDTPGATNDGFLNSFHEPFALVGGNIVWTETPGRLSKLQLDRDDIWTIDLKVPTFDGFSAQDWADFVHEFNPNANPDDYVLDPDDEHKVFGCNLWVEVTEISEVPAG